MARLAWWEDAACFGMAPMFDLDREDYESYDEGFALEKGITPKLGRSKTKQMIIVERICLRVCAECPVRQDCLEDALHHRDKHTIRGGLTADQRIELMKQMGVDVDD